MLLLRSLVTAVLGHNPTPEALSISCLLHFPGLRHAGGEQSRPCKTDLYSARKSLIEAHDPENGLTSFPTFPSSRQ